MCPSYTYHYPICWHQQSREVTCHNSSWDPQLSIFNDCAELIISITSNQFKMVNHAFGKEFVFYALVLSQKYKGRPQLYVWLWC